MKDGLIALLELRRLKEVRRINDPKYFLIIDLSAIIKTFFVVKDKIQELLENPFAVAESSLEQML